MFYFGRLRELCLCFFASSKVEHPTFEVTMHLVLGLPQFSEIRKGSAKYRDTLDEGIAHEIRDDRVNTKGVSVRYGDRCLCGVVVSDAHQSSPARKPTGWMCSVPEILNVLGVIGKNDSTLGHHHHSTANATTLLPSHIASGTNWIECWTARR